ISQGPAMLGVPSASGAGLQASIAHFEQQLANIDRQLADTENQLSTALLQQTTTTMPVSAKVTYDGYRRRRYESAFPEYASWQSYEHRGMHPVRYSTRYRHRPAMHYERRFRGVSRYSYQRPGQYFDDES